MLKGKEEEKLVTIAFRVAPSLLERVEETRGKQPKSEFFREAIDAHLSGQYSSLPSVESDDPLTELINEFLDAVYRKRWADKAKDVPNETEALVNILCAFIDSRSSYAYPDGQPEMLVAEDEPTGPVAVDTEPEIDYKAIKEKARKKRPQDESGQQSA